MIDKAFTLGLLGELVRVALEWQRLDSGRFSI